MLSNQKISIAAVDRNLAATKNLHGLDLLVASDDQCFVIAGFENANARNEVSIRCMELIQRTGCLLVGLARSEQGTDALVRTSNPETKKAVDKHSKEVFGTGVTVRYTV